MDKIITQENLRNFCYVNDGVCQKPIRGIVVHFMGLGGTMMYSEETEQGLFYGTRGILYLVPYNNPWAWMNPQAVAYTDEILDVLIAQYALPENIPIVSTGLSMGGLSALVYAKRAKRTPAACVTNCPVCDLPYHYTERPDLPRTLYSAFFREPGALEDVLKQASPLHLVGQLPKIPYRIFHCGADELVNLEKHSLRLVSAMQAAGYDVALEIIPERGHCQLTEEATQKYAQYCIEAVENAKG